MNGIRKTECNDVFVIYPKRAPEFVLCCACGRIAVYRRRPWLKRGMKAKPVLQLTGKEAAAFSDYFGFQAEPASDPMLSFANRSDVETEYWAVDDSYIVPSKHVKTLQSRIEQVAETCRRQR